MEVFVSPGVYTQELDESFVPAGAGAIGAALIGLTQKGPAFRPVQVNNFGEFRETFGGLSTDKYMPYAAKSYLRNGTSLQVVRTLGRGTKSQGNVGLLSFPTPSNITSISAVSADQTILGIVRRRTTGGSVGENPMDILLSGTPTNFALSADNEVVIGLSLTESSGNYIKKVLGTDPEESKSGEQLTGLYVDAVFNYAVGDHAGNIAGPVATHSKVSCTAGGDSFEEITGGFTGAQTPFIVSQNHSGTVYELFRFFTTAHGDHENSNVKIGITQVAYTDSASAFPSFTVIVRKFDDTDREPIIHETFINCNLNPASKQYIARVIGDRRPVYDLTQDPPEILYDGDYPNRSRFVRVEVGSGFPSSARPAGFKGIPKLAAIPKNDYAVSGTAYVPVLPTKLNHLNTRSAVDAGVFVGIDFDNPGVSDRLKKTVTSSSGTTSADDGILCFVNAADYTGSTNTTNFTRIDILGTNSSNYSSTNKVRFTVPFYDGWDGFDQRSNLLTDMVATDTTGLSGDLNIGIKTLANADEIDFNLLAIPGAHSSGSGNIPDRAIEMVERRADAFFLLDIADAATTGAGLALSVANAITEAQKYDSNYAATYFPWTRINDVDNDKLVWVPPSVEMMGVYSFNDRVAQPWFAPAGFNRGGMDNVIEVRRRLTQSQRDDLYSDNVNPIATFPGQGIVVFGQKTLQKKQSVLDRVNVRRMLIEVRKTIAGLSRLFLFEANTVTVREKLLSQVNDYLGSVQAAQGLTEFRAVLDETTTTPDLIDRNVMKGKIYLKPTSVAEIIIFDFNVTPQGATFSE
tara:strand:+ start:8374 stop:10776 length:2403 start_codon:yes stop_codon:yes gene_type:complete